MGDSSRQGARLKQRSLVPIASFTARPPCVDSSSVNGIAEPGQDAWSRRPRSITNASARAVDASAIGAEEAARRNDLADA
jgi:hypothetical protein